MADSIEKRTIEARKTAADRRLERLVESLALLEEGQRKKVTMAPENWVQVRQLVADRYGWLVERKEAGQPIQRDGWLEYRWWMWRGEKLEIDADYRAHGLRPPEKPDDFPEYVLKCTDAALKLMAMWENWEKVYGVATLDPVSGKPRQTGLMMYIPTALLGTIVVDPSQVDKQKYPKDALWKAQIIGYYAGVLREWWTCGFPAFPTPEDRERLEGHVCEDDRDCVLITDRNEAPELEVIWRRYRNLDPWIGSGMDKIRESATFIDTYPAMESEQAKNLMQVLNKNNRAWYERFSRLYWKKVCDALNESAISASTPHSWPDSNHYRSIPSNTLPCSQMWRTLWWPWVFENQEEDPDEKAKAPGQGGLRSWPETAVPRGLRVMPGLPWPEACFVSTDQQAICRSPMPPSRITSAMSSHLTTRVPAWRIWDPVMVVDVSVWLGDRAMRAPIPCVFSMNWVKDLGLCLAAAEDQFDPDPRCYKTLLDMAKGERVTIVEILASYFGPCSIGAIDDTLPGGEPFHGVVPFFPVMEGKFQYGDGHNPLVVWPNQKQWPGQLTNRRWRFFREVENEASARVAMKYIGTDMEDMPKRSPDDFERIAPVYTRAGTRMSEADMFEYFTSEVPEHVSVEEQSQGTGEGE